MASTEPQRWFKSRLLRREAQTFTDLAAIAKKRGWRFMASNYAFKAVALKRHADYLVDDLAPF